MWKIFQRIKETSKQKKLEHECLDIYSENIRMVKWYLQTQCNLSKEDIYKIMTELVEEMREKVEELHGKDKRKQGEWVLYHTYLIANRTFKDIPEVCYRDEN